MKILTDLLVSAGWISVSYGAWLIYEPAGYLVAGILAMVAGIAVERAGAGK